jgi:cytidylate kinase
LPTWGYGEEEGVIVAIDGPAGSGKSTVAREVAGCLGFTYLDTGAMYRAVTLLALENGVLLDDAPSLGALAVEAELAFSSDAPSHGTSSSSADGLPRLFAGGHDITLAIRSPEVTAAVSQVSAHRDVRTAMTIKQRELAAAGDTVLEGRDTGTVVCPDADVKVFLTASLAERARRRRDQFVEQGVAVEADQVERDIATRDRYDSGRSLAPLTRAPDAVEIDTTVLTVEQVVEKVCALVESERKAAKLKAAEA